jgi:excisionase family DNA binding protein
MLDSRGIPESTSRNDRHDVPLLMSVSDGMKTLRVGRTKFYQLIATGELEIVKIGTATRVVVSSIKDYVDRLRAQATKNGT